MAVNGELVSDELRGTYKIIMPSPQTPRATLAPNTYKTRQRVRLKPGKDNENDSDIVIYYTVDGSSPDADSPISTGEAIQLPSGWVTLKAVAVNRYNKVSNTLEIKYKIEAKPFPLSAWDMTEPITGLNLYQTAMMDFQKEYGEGTLAEEYASAEFDSDCRRYEYPWGYAVMNRTRSGWVLVELYLTNSGTFKLPRGTNIGDSESFVVGKFRDMGQVESASGNRGLYDVGDGTGKIWLQEDGTKIIRYRCTTSDGRWQQLDYLVSKAGTVYAVDWKYEPYAKEPRPLPASAGSGLVISKGRSRQNGGLIRNSRPSSAGSRPPVSSFSDTAHSRRLRTLRSRFSPRSPYRSSPRMGCPRAARCARIWWVRPVIRSTLSRETGPASIVSYPVRMGLAPGQG